MLECYWWNNDISCSITSSRYFSDLFEEIFHPSHVFFRCIRVHLTSIQEIKDVTTEENLFVRYVMQ